MGKKLTFEGLGIPEELMTAVKRGGYRESTPLQVEVIPVGLQGRDVIGVAGIATGRTLAFGLPMLERVRTGRGIGLALLPEKKVAEQVLKRFERVGRALDISSALIADGGEKEEAALKAGPGIIIGTPAAVLERLRHGLIPAGKVATLAIDEMDFILERFPRETLEEIVRLLPAARQTFVFGKSIPDGAEALAGLKEPYRAVAAEPEWKRKKRSREQNEDGAGPRSFLPPRPWRGIPVSETLEEAVAVSLTELWPGELLPGAARKEGKRNRRRGRR